MTACCYMSGYIELDDMLKNCTSCFFLKPNQQNALLYKKTKNVDFLNSTNVMYHARVISMLVRHETEECQHGKQ